MAHMYYLGIIVEGPALVAASEASLWEFRVRFKGLGFRGLRV